MNVGIYFNRKYFDETAPYIEKIESALKSHSIDCKCVNNLSDIKGLDVLMVLGGDGTILMTAAECAMHDVKIIGINRGHLGFLAEFEPEKLDKAIEIVCSGKFKIEERTLMKIEFADKTYYALNDLVIQRSTSGNAFSNTINLRAEINNSVVADCSADGIIVSTPTGSTAYSLAAGGSILTPDIDAFILTPICAHSLNSRPIVFKDTSTLFLHHTDKRSEINLIVDGMAVAAMADCCTVKVTKAQKKLQFIVSEDSDFFDKLLIKLKLWSK
jgi:NAD+ kinase